jgi:hypothetical protein
MKELWRLMENWLILTLQGVVMTHGEMALGESTVLAVMAHGEMAHGDSTVFV